MTQTLEALAVTQLKGVGPRVAQKLARIGIHTVADLLFHLPLRYQDRTRVTALCDLRVGAEAVIVGTVESSELQLHRRRMLVSRINDASGAISLRFFHFGVAQQKLLENGRQLLCFGEVRSGSGGLEMIHPEVRPVDGQELPELDDALTPVYPTTEGLHQTRLRALTDQALQHLQQYGLHDWLPQSVLSERGMPTLHDALSYVHRPPADAPVNVLLNGCYPAQQRLAFEELLAHHLSLRRIRVMQRQRPAPALKVPGQLFKRLLNHLPFKLTGAQQRVVKGLLAELRQGQVMQRLVQGDVGCGKTLVAMAAVLQAVEAGYQAAIMAPTELLAEQHFSNFQQWCGLLDIEVACLSARLKSAARRELLQSLHSGQLSVVVGTHALFQDNVAFHKLGLVVIDEQHRFGVQQRLSLFEKGAGDHGYPHQLVMTATPIPRSLAMTAYGDLDVSVIDELPPGRQPVETVVVSDSRRAQVVERVHNACRNGCQAYWVCTLIDESEVLQCQAAADTAEALKEALQDLRVGLVHGRMKSQEKSAVMAAFKAGEIDLLVATTVIEVGVDVANASLMVIENAERLGLAQLHQLRGRVGRGSEKSSCVLMYRRPLSRLGQSRLAVMREVSDGFEVARRDLALRGPGEVLGTRQSGAIRLRIADLIRDQQLVPAVTEVAETLLEHYPEHVNPLIERWLGDVCRYGEV
ncbi:MAG: ATP-dependent DNA helicase RecG [Gammaproteobacteria bacterium]|nr:ATP-dependent DNA helicase RecG [Gammaproteobacteria bacterium]